MPAKRTRTTLAKMTFGARTPSTDSLQPLKILARIFGVPKSRLIDLEHAGRVKFEWRRLGPWLGRVGRPSWFVNQPMYDCTDTARIVGVSPRTIRRWVAAGRLHREAVLPRRRKRITPMEVFRCRQEYHDRPGVGPVPTLEQVMARSRRRRRPTASGTS